MTGSRVLAVVGDLVEDVVAWVTAEIERGSDTPARIFRSRGGSGANVAVAAAPHVPTRFFGCVGVDGLGELLVDQLAAEGVDVRVQRRGRTGCVVVIVDSSGERTMLPDRAASAELHEVPEQWLQDVAVLHVPSYSLDGGATADTVRRLLAEAPARGIRTTIDTSATSVLRRLGVADYRALIRQVQPAVLFANAEEAAVLHLRQEPLSCGTTVVIKDGPRPTTVLDAHGRTTTVPVPPVEVVHDSTGAGDAFAAGYLAALLDEATPVECVERGHALARRVLSTPGFGFEGTVAS